MHMLEKNIQFGMNHDKYTLKYHINLWHVTLPKTEVANVSCVWIFHMGNKAMKVFEEALKKCKKLHLNCNKMKLIREKIVKFVMVDQPLLHD